MTSELRVPEDLRYTSEHEWVASTSGASVRVGITDFAQDALGDIVFVDLPAVGTAVQAGAPLGEVESTKSVSEIFAPVTGIVVARNDQLGQSPELINSDPYGDGWLLDIEPTSPDDVDNLLDAAGYTALTSKND